MAIVIFEEKMLDLDLKNNKIVKCLFIINICYNNYSVINDWGVLI